MTARRYLDEPDTAPGNRDRYGDDAAHPVRQTKVRARLAAFWEDHHDVVGNAASLVGTTGVTAVLGFGFWAVAARLFSQQDVGYGSAVVSAFTLFGSVGMLGLGTVLIAELPRRTEVSGLISAALLTSAIASFLLGVAFTIVTAAFGSRWEEFSGTPIRAMLFIAGVTLTGVSLVFDQATIGLLRGGLQLVRNFTFSLTKLIALPAAALVVFNGHGTGLEIAWIVGIVLSVVPVVIRVRRTRTTLFGKPDWRSLRRIGRVMLAHNWLNLALQIPVFVMPLLVTAAISARAAAAFYAAEMLSNFIYIIPGHLSTVLFAIGSGRQDSLTRELRFTLKISYLLGIPGMAILITGGHFILGFFGAGYESAGSFILIALTIGYIPTSFRSFYVAVKRSKGQISRAAAVITPAAVVRIAACAVVGATYGIRGLGYTLLAVSFGECLITAPTVLAAASRIGRHRRAAPGSAADFPARQQGGLEMLLSLASTVASVPGGWVTMAGQVGAVGAGVEERLRSAPASGSHVSYDGARLMSSGSVRKRHQARSDAVDSFKPDSRAQTRALHFRKG